MAARRMLGSKVSDGNGYKVWRMRIHSNPCFAKRCVSEMASAMVAGSFSGMLSDSEITFPRERTIYLREYPNEKRLNHWEV